jgi:predicted RNA-binding protein Jag
VEAERLARVDAERVEAERLAQVEAERVEAERRAQVETERVEAERVEAERVEAERVEAERLAQVEAERVEAERLAQVEAERVEAERLAQVEAERVEAERLAQVEAERVAAVAAAADDAGSLDGECGPDLLVREGDIAGEYLARLLDIIDYDGDLELWVENGHAVVAIVGDSCKALIGPGNQTLDALQELIRLAVEQKTGIRSELVLEISGQRQAQAQSTELAGAAQR